MLNLDDNTYIDILVNDSSISGMGVYVAIAIFKSKDEYERYCDRSVQIGTFISKIKSLQKEILFSGTENITDLWMLNDILNWGSRNYRYKEKCPHTDFQLFTQIEDELFAPPEFKESRYSDHQWELLKNCGYDSSWLEDPVKIMSIKKLYVSNTIPTEPFSEGLLVSLLKKNFYASENDTYIEGPDTSEFIVEDDK